MENVRPEVLKFATMMNNAMRFLYQGRLYEKHWSADFRAEEANRIFEQVEKEQLELPNITTLSKEELEILGFGHWQRNQYGVPSHLLKVAIRDGVMTPESDTDTRFGIYFAFVTPKGA